MRNWQSMRSMIPPWPGIVLPKSLTWKVRFKPDAKKPPNGAISDANVARAATWKWMVGNAMLSVWSKGCKNEGTRWTDGRNTGLGVQVKSDQALMPISEMGQMK